MKQLSLLMFLLKRESWCEADPLITAYPNQADYKRTSNRKEKYINLICFCNFFSPMFLRVGLCFLCCRLIYWLCLSLGSSIRGLGFGFSFFPILVMLGANLYYICASVGQGAVFDVEPPTTAPPPPKLRWWG